jgi:hypothetical protein
MPIMRDHMIQTGLHALDAPEVRIHYINGFKEGWSFEFPMRPGSDDRFVVPLPVFTFHRITGSGRSKPVLDAMMDYVADRARGFRGFLLHVDCIKFRKSAAAWYRGRHEG